MYGWEEIRGQMHTDLQTTAADHLSAVCRQTALK